MRVIRYLQSWGQTDEPSGNQIEEVSDLVAYN